MFVPAFAIDATLSDSFPASDPPSWNPAIVRPSPAGVIASPAFVTDVLDLSRPKDAPAFLQALVSVGAAAGIALLVPFVILVAAAPFALALRGVAEGIAWIVRMVA
jgi:hypothetical protein